MQLSKLVGPSLAVAALVGSSVVPASASVFESQTFAALHIPQPRIVSRSEALNYMHPRATHYQFTQAARKWALTHHVNPPAKVPGSKITSYLTDAGTSYIWEFSGKHIASYATDCYGPEGGVVDHAKNFVVACTDSTSVNVYAAGDTGSATTVLDGTPSFYPADAFEDTSGNVYATTLYGFECGSTYCYEYPGTVEEWPKGAASGSSPTNVYTDPNLFEVYFGDIAADGTIYLDGFNNSFYPEVDACTVVSGALDCTNTGIVVNFPGGINALKSGEIGVNDQGQYGAGDGTYQEYTTAYTSTFSGSFPQSLTNTCDPVSTGWNKAENEVGAGDAGCRAEAYLKTSGASGDILNINFSEPIGYAASPSDK